MEPSSFPTQYGGELEWKWGDMPNLDEPARELVGALETAPAEGKSKRGFIKGPVLFNDNKIEVLGTVNGDKRREVIPVPEKKGTEEPKSENIADAEPDAEPTTAPLAARNANAAQSEKPQQELQPDDQIERAKTENSDSIESATTAVSRNDASAAKSPLAKENEISNGDTGIAQQTTTATVS